MASGALLCSTLLCDKEMFAEGEYLDKVIKRSTLERGTIEGNSPVFKNNFTLLAVFLEYCRA